MMTKTIRTMTNWKKKAANLSIEPSERVLARNFSIRGFKVYLEYMESIMKQCSYIYIKHNMCEISVTCVCLDGYDSITRTSGFKTYPSMLN